MGTSKEEEKNVMAEGEIIVLDEATEVAAWLASWRRKVVAPPEKLKNLYSEG